MDKGGVNCQFILLINSRCPLSFIIFDSECAKLRVLMMYGHNLGGLLLLSLFVQHLASVVAIEILTTWEKMIKKGMCLCCFVLFHFWSHILIKEKNSFKLRTFFLIRKICPSVHTLTTNFLCKNKYNDIICQDWGKSFCQAFALYPRNKTRHSITLIIF